MLFVPVVGGLNILFRKKERAGLIHGLMGSSSVTFINLQYADDTLIFRRDNVREVAYIKWVLCYFGAWLGLIINSYKNSFISLGPKNLSLSLILDIFICKENVFPIKYLSIPIKLGKLSKQEWNSLLDFFEKRLEVWGSNLFSLGGRVVILNTVLFILSLYYMFFFLLPC